MKSAHKLAACGYEADSCTVIWHIAKSVFFFEGVEPCA
jgi:hypothetical protein